MSETFSKVEVITGVARRRRFPMDQKLAVVAETMQPGMSISYVARRHGLSPSLVFRWRRLMSEGGKEAIRADEEVVPASEARKLEDRVRELERLLGRKTMEVEILKEAHWPDHAAALWKRLTLSDDELDDLRDAVARIVIGLDSATGPAFMSNSPAFMRLNRD